MDSRELVWFGVGFFALSLGNAVGAVHMFRGRVIFVTIGVGLMFGGFEMMHYGAHGEGMVTELWGRSSQAGPGSEVSLRTWILSPVLLLIAIYCIAQGFVIGAQAAVHSFTLVDMGATGVFIVGGYMTGHMAVHRVPL